MYYSYLLIIYECILSNIYIYIHTFCLILTDGITYNILIFIICFYSLDCFNLKPIYKGSPASKCAFCGSSYSPDYKGKLCLTCEISAVGVETVGLVTQGGPGTKHT